MSQGGLAPDDYRELVRRALDEDRGRGDATSAAVITKGQRARGVILAKSELVVAGFDVAAETFRQLDSAVVIEVLWSDGSRVGANEPIAFVTGDAISLAHRRANSAELPAAPQRHCHVDGEVCGRGRGTHHHSRYA